MQIVVLFGSYGRNHECILKGQNKYNTGVFHWKVNKCWNASSSLIQSILNYRMWVLTKKPLLYPVNKYVLYLHREKCVLFLGDNCVVSWLWCSGLVNNHTCYKSQTLYVTVCFDYKSDCLCRVWIENMKMKISAYEIV